MTTDLNALRAREERLAVVLDALKKLAATCVAYGDLLEAKNYSAVAKELESILNEGKT